ncbi:TIR domain-containing protein [Koleobacter methoxysyntrophicus]|nr:TIR domain-containing protein [Koleobacter methoxysyntrophicus]
MARRVFFSFHYERDVWRANVYIAPQNLWRKSV